MPCVQRSKLANPSEAKPTLDAAKRLYNNGKKRLTGRSENSTHAIRAELSRDSDPTAAGTIPAIKDKVLSAATIAPAAGQITRMLAAPKLGPFRGADGSKVERNKQGRRSTALRLSEVRNIMAAGVFTAQEHRPLNRHTTIHFDKCGIADPVTALGRFMKLARDWLATKGALFAYIWVRESGEHKGEHAHILMHVPPHLVRAFARREPGWRRRIGAKRAARSFRSTPVGRSYRHADVGVQYGEQYSDHLRRILGYLAKGAEPRAVKACQLSLVEPGGALCGKRCGMSENINRAARSRRAS